ncbi:zinc ABC transporter substrate-binding protein [Roseibacterium beibuensis]|uniref:metal ABC transporter solute-binding protein, Zn/Mn family n=1 Tax=[Roseibacterium] beibuensis TaxID=1193142 RepID=UPI00217E0DB3|nr:zinc ABC transporter substrate-binding protein [Roseibacterium beibuensis]MCS6626881.1 zinc ABC transporter substrate-binding protein [Roseibacterium beibuensis]
MLRRTFFGFVAACAASFPFGAAAQERLNVVATTGMIADVARVVGGDVVEVSALMGPGVDPHAYRQTRSDIVALSRADLILWNGLYLEAQLEQLLLDLAERQPVVAVGEGVPVEMRLANEDYADRFDPHVWMDPARWSYVVETVAAALTEASPDHAGEFDRNADAYLEQLAALGEYSEDVLGSVPEASRVLISAHDAFSYFGEAYGFDVVGIQGISTESEAGLQRIAELVDMIVAREVGAVFVETSVSDRNIRALIEGAAAQGHEVVIGGELFSDAMGEPGTYEGTWLGMIDHNVTTIARALGGSAPDAGFAGHLGMN